MHILGRLTPGSLLTVIGRNGAIVMLLSIVAGLTLPGLGGHLRPWLPYALGATVVGSFLAATYSIERSWVQGYTLAVAAWTIVAPAAIVVSVTRGLGIEAGLATGLVLATVTPPSAAVPAFAALLNLSPKLALAVYLAAMLAAPLSLPVVAQLSGIELKLDPLSFALRLLATVGGGVVVALVIHRFAARFRWLVPEQAAAGGMATLGLFFLFAAGSAIVREQWSVEGFGFAGLIAVAIASSVILLVVGAAVFSWLGLADALTVGLLSGTRNTALIYAMTAGFIPAKTEAYLGATMIVIALMPFTFQQSVKLARRLGDRRVPAMADIVWHTVADPAHVELRMVQSGRRYRIGRSLDAELRLDASTVSRRHAELWVERDGRVRVRDLASANGVVHNGKRVGEVVLQPGEAVHIGPYRLGVAGESTEAVTVEWYRVSDPHDIDGRAFTMAGTYRIGRSRSADIKLLDPMVSSSHAELVIGGDGGVILRDSGSRNGLFVEGERVGEVRLDQVAEAQVGPFALKLRRTGTVSREGKRA